MAARSSVPVLVLGAGPAGLAVVADLAWRGIRCLVVGRSGVSLPPSPMDLVDIRTMEFCRRWGLVSDIEAAGYNRFYPQDCAWVTSLRGLEFGREPIPAIAQAQNPPLSPQHSERLPPARFELVLRRFAERTGLVEFADDTELVEFDDSGSDVSVVLLSADGRVRVVGASYLVAADAVGAGVREMLGVEMVTGGEPINYVDVVIRCDDLEQQHTTRPAYRFDFVGVEGRWGELAALNGRDEWRFSFFEGPAYPTTKSELHGAIVRAIGSDIPFEILSATFYSRPFAVAENFSKGRVFLVGEAAHGTPSVGAIDRNGGVLDAVDLSWKLAAAINGWAGPALLDSYDAEQRPLAHLDMGDALENRRLLLSAPFAQPSPILFDFSDITTPAMSARREFGDAYTETASPLWYTIGAQLGYQYDESRVIVPDGTVASERTLSSYLPSARPGSRAPHVWLDDEHTISTLDLFGRDFVLLRFNQQVDVEVLLALADATATPMRLVDVESPVAAARYERPLVLVRPDGQVAWRGQNVEHAAEVLATVTGRG
jgi:2-polyprenyl-6-methoxyphenol hydroxylase-like FAD-dependent oxidoreductase